MRSYLDSIRALDRYLQEHGLPTDVDGVQAEHIRGHLAAIKRRTSVGNEAAHYRNLRVFWNWAVREHERASGISPMINIDKPAVPKKAHRFLTDAEILALLDTCGTSAFMDIRDKAIIRIFVDIGIRVSGLTGLRYDPADQ